MRTVGKGIISGLFAVAVAAASLTVVAPGTAGAAGSATIETALTSAIADLAPGDEIAAIAVVAPSPLVPLVPALEALGLEIVTFDHLPVVAIQGTATEVLAAATVPGVVSMWNNGEVELALAESRAMIGADAVHDDPDLGFTGAGVGIAVLDSGIDGFHPDLAFGTKTVQNVKILGNQYLGSSQTGGATWGAPTLAVEDVVDTDTTVGHGTHVAAVAAGDGSASGGLYEGVAPGADLIGVGAGDVGYVLTTLAAFEWILDHHDEYGIRVVNNSWADGTIAYDPGHPLNLASKAAHDAGIVVVFAAGNDGQTAGNVYNRYAYPDWVIGVGGVTKLGTLGDYSSRGDVDHHADIVAPGSYIASARAITGVTHDLNSSPFDLTDPLAPKMIAPEYTLYYTAATGTSFSAPHVTGVVALMLEANPSLTPDQVKQILVDTATPVEGCAVVDCGAGMVNAVNAVTAALATQNEAPVAILQADSPTGAAPLTVTFDAGDSSDVDGTIDAYEWDLDGDGVFETVGAPVQVRTYAAGSTTVSLRVVDDDGAPSAPTSLEVRSSDAPTAVVAAPTQARSGDLVTIDASASSDPDGSIVEYRFTFGDGAEVTSTDPVVTHTWTAERTERFVWTVAVIDDAGVADGASGTIKIKRAQPAS